MKLFRKKSEVAEEAENLPRHIAVIMDGNGRWAKKRGLPRSAGHAAGAETFRRVAAYCRDIGLEHLTAYAFSTENWKRPTDEVDAIMELLGKYLTEAIETMERDRLKLRIMGDTSALDNRLQSMIEKTAELSSRYEGCQINLCVNYGGRAEIVRAAQSYARDYAEGKAGKLTDSLFSGYMYSSGTPDPDLIIRPSGEIRLSNFLLWQSAYAELYFTDKLWPDFGESDIKSAVAEYRKRHRRYGDVK